jgi:hypothetical protein
VLFCKKITIIGGTALSTQTPTLKATYIIVIMVIVSMMLMIALVHSSFNKQKAYYEAQCFKADTYG